MIRIRIWEPNINNSTPEAATEYNTVSLIKPNLIFFFFHRNTGSLMELFYAHTFTSAYTV